MPIRSSTRRSRMRFIAPAFVSLAVILCAGCPQKPQPPSPPVTPGPQTTKAPAKPAGEIRIGYALSTIGHEFFVNMLDGIKDEAKKQRVTILDTNANADAAKQLTDVEDLLQKGVSAMMITPQDSDAIVPAVEACNKRGVPVVIVDIGASGGKVDCFIISDNLEGGRIAGRYIAEHVNPGAKVIHIQCQLGAANARKRGEGFTEIMKQKGIEVVAQQPADSRRDLGMTVMENLLQAHRQVDAVFAENDPMAVGAMLAAKNAGRLKDMIVVGFNGDREALDAIAAGDMAATVIQFPYDMGVTGVQMAAKLAKGEKVEPVVNVPVELVTKDNISKYDVYKRKPS